MVAMNKVSLQHNSLKQIIEIKKKKSGDTSRTQLQAVWSGFKGPKIVSGISSPSPFSGKPRPLFYLSLFKSATFFSLQNRLTLGNFQFLSLHNFNLHVALYVLAVLQAPNSISLPFLSLVVQNFPTGFYHFSCPVSHLIQFIVLSGLVLPATVIVKAFSQVQGQGADYFGRESGGDKYQYL